MGKPVVFFSHSSHDAEILGRLKQQFVKYTGGTIEVFLSSDGQSVQFGKNWVVRIEEALSEAKLMFAFITPRSQASQWMLFEMGHAHGRGVRVVPVGLAGIDLQHQKPPVSLIQGFNVQSGDGLNNIVAVVNEEFDHSHNLSFTSDDFAELVKLNSPTASLALGRSAEMISALYLSLVLPQPKPFDLEAVREKLEQHGIQCHSQARNLAAIGFSIDVYGVFGNGSIQLQFAIDPSVVGSIASAIEDVANSLDEDGLAGSTLTIHFDEGTRLETRDFVLSGRLRDLGVCIHDGGKLRFANIAISPNHSGHSDHSAALEVQFLESHFPLSDIATFLDALLDERLLVAGY